MQPYLELDGTRVIAHGCGAGPWDPSMLHGGVPAALVARVVEDLPTAVPMRVTRLTVDLQRPVPVGELALDVAVTREGRNIQTSEVILSANGKVVVRGAALKIREAAGLQPEGTGLPTVRGLPPEKAPNDLVSVGFNETVEWRDAYPEDKGRAQRAVWCNIQRPFLEDHETTPLMRAAVTGDYCNGFGSQLDFNQWTYINADLTLHFARAPVGDWMMLAADCLIGPEGRAIAYGDLADVAGVFGRATQSQVIARRA
ncbi:MAG: thioesterase family protein [Pseudomonadota bacterium]